MLTKPMENITATDLKNLLKNPKLFVLDVRTVPEFQSGALQGAELIPVAELPSRLQELPENPETPILVYCAHGVRSLAAVQILEKAGYTQLFNLRPGIAGVDRSEWKK